jgi:hypothetical protein
MKIIIPKGKPEIPAMKYNPKIIQKVDCLD